MKNKTAQEIIEKIKKKLTSHNFMDKNRTSSKYFTRKRKLPFTSIVYFLLNSVKQTLQKEITSFIHLISSHKNVSKSAFCQQRVKLKPEAFIELNDVLINEFYTDNEFEKWEGFRLLGIDGSKLVLPKSKEIREEFGELKTQGELIPMALISTCYDLLNEIMIDSHIVPYHTSEHALALKHIEKCQEEDLLIYDRGYGACWLFYYMHLHKVNYVVRVQKNFISEVREFWNTNEESKVIEIKNFSQRSAKALNVLGIKPKPFKIRLVRVILDNGEIEVLVTSLLDEEKFPTNIFKPLYFKRWRTEVNYDHLKNQIEIGNFTGYLPQAIKQDFYANMLIANLQSIIIRDSELELQERKINNKRQYKINRNLSLGFMKNRIIKILTQKNNTNYMEELKELFLMEPVPIRDGRIFPRNTNRIRKKYHINKKRAT